MNLNETATLIVIITTISTLAGGLIIMFLKSKGYITRDEVDKSLAEVKTENSKLMNMFDTQFNKINENLASINEMVIESIGNINLKLDRNIERIEDKIDKLKEEFTQQIVDVEKTWNINLKENYKCIPHYEQDKVVFEKRIMLAELQVNKVDQAIENINSRMTDVITLVTKIMDSITIVKKSNKR